MNTKNTGDSGHKLKKNKRHPREFFIHPKVAVTIKSLDEFGIKPIPRWKYRCPWNDNDAQKNIYRISPLDLLEFIRRETERTEKERYEHKKDPSKNIFFSSFHVYTRNDGPGSPLKFAFSFSRESYIKNRSAELRDQRSKRYKKPSLSYVRDCSWHFDKEAYEQQILEDNKRIRNMVRKETPRERAESRWVKVVCQNDFPKVSVPTLAYSKPKREHALIETNLQVTMKKNIEDAEKRKWKAPSKDYQVGASDTNAKERLRQLFLGLGYEYLALQFAEKNEKHIQADVPSNLVMRIFEIVASNNSLHLNIYKKDRDGYPVIKHCFPNNADRNDYEKGAEVAFFQKTQI